MLRHKLSSCPDSWISDNYTGSHTKERQYAGHLHESLQTTSTLPMSADARDSGQQVPFYNKSPSYKYRRHRQPVLHTFPPPSSSRGKRHHGQFPVSHNSDSQYYVRSWTDVHSPADDLPRHCCRKPHFRLHYHHKVLYPRV